MTRSTRTIDAVTGPQNASGTGSWSTSALAKRKISLLENELLSRPPPVSQPRAVCLQTDSLQLVMGECILPVRINCKKECRDLRKSQFACRHHPRTALGMTGVSAEKRGEHPKGAPRRKSLQARPPVRQDRPADLPVDPNASPFYLALISFLLAIRSSPSACAAIYNADDSLMIISCRRSRPPPPSLPLPRADELSHACASLWRL